MMEMIRDKKADSIICWKLDRLTRNPVDTGLIQYSLQKELLKSIVTSDREYLPQDAGLLFSVETGNANQFIMDLSKNTKRWMQWKADRWGLGWPAPHGYINDVINKTVIADPERFDTVRRMWDLMLTGMHSVKDIATIANEEWWFQTVRKKKVWGSPISISTLNHIFHNPFYKWVIRFKGSIKQGAHQPMVTPGEFERVQKVISGTDSVDTERPHKHSFAFTGCIKCADCWCSITAERKTKHSKNGNKHEYTYYHCTHKKDTKTHRCNQRGTIIQSELEKQIIQILSRIEIHKDFVTFAKRVIREKHQDEIVAQISIRNRVNNDIETSNKQLWRLLSLLLDESITKAEYDEQKATIKKQIEILESQRNVQKDNTLNWVDIVENTLDFVSKAKEQFLSWDIDTKKAIFKALGSNLSLKDGKLSLELHSWFAPFGKLHGHAYGGLSRLEPIKKSTSIKNTSASSSQNSIWLQTLNEFRTLDWKKIKTQFEVTGLLSFWKERVIL